MSFISRVLWGQFYEDFYGNARELTWRNRAYGLVFPVNMLTHAGSANGELLRTEII